MLYSELIESHLEDPRVVLSDGKTEYTFKQLHARARACGAYLRSRGVKTGDCVLIMDREPLETVVLLLACISEGIVFVPVSMHIGAEDREKIIQSCAPALIVDRETAIEDSISPNRVKENRKKLPVDTLVYILYTSGTEGRMKGVCGKQKQILFCTEAINKRIENSGKDRILCCLPLTFDYGLYQVFLAFMSGAQLYLDDGEMLQRIPYLLRQWKITAFPTLPTVAALLVRIGLLDHKEDFCLRYISFTGEVLPVPLIREFQRALPGTNIIPMYGMTECKRVTVMPIERIDKILAGSCGLPLDGVKVWLVNKDERTGVGELVVEGPNVMEGYWGISDEDSGVFETDHTTGVRKVYTGDLFYIDNEGFLYFRGRRNGILKIRGYRVSSFWIEERIRVLKGVKETVVTSVEDSVTGERAVIFVYGENNTVGPVVEDAIRRMPLYLRNTELFISGEPFPRNRNGKVDIKKLLAMAKRRDGFEVLRK